MTDTKNTSETKETTIVTVSPETNALVEKEMAGESDQLKQETKALVEAIKKRAQSEIENDQTLTRDAYLTAVRSARETIEKNELLDPKRIEHSVEIIQKDAQENWQKIVEEISDLGDYAPRTLRIAFKKLPRQLGILMGKNSSGTK